MAAAALQIEYRTRSASLIVSTLPMAGGMTRMNRAYNDSVNIGYAVE
jgi:hypothetical protein